MQTTTNSTTTPTTANQFGPHPIPFFLNNARATLVKYEFSERRNLYYVKILCSNGDGYTFKYKFRRKDKATRLVDKINRVRRLDLRYWNRIRRPGPTYLQSRLGRPDLWEALHYYNWVIH